MTLNLESLYHSNGGAMPLLQEGLRLLADTATSDNETDGHTVGADDAHGDDGHSGFGVHITYQQLYSSIVFLVCVYVSGQIASRLLKMPDLVGQIICGILLGPNLAMYVPLPTTWVLLGEIGLILLVIEAGIDIDLDMLKLIGARGFMIAVVGSLLPIAIGIGLAAAMIQDEFGIQGSIAAGAAFGPTSLGIALNILRSGGILNTPIGQLIIAAAVIDDMIALIVLSMLQTLTAPQITAAAIVIPIVSALGFLFIGGYIAIFVAPRLIDRFLLAKTPDRYHAKIELALMFGLLLGLMPATYYAKASFLMGAFLAGLGFCSSHGLHALFVAQFKRILAWLMRIFFAASIGFQVPNKEFGNGTVIWQGLVFTLALLGKLAVGFMVPNFTQDRRFTGIHFRDCMMTGFSMAAEGEFAFVIAVFAFDNDLISKTTYSSVVLAVLISTIVPPFALRFTVSYYNKKAERAIADAAAAELERLGKAGTTKSEADLVEAIKKNSTFFLCIQTQSESSWGLMHKIMNTMQRLGLDVIDHRSWHPRGINTTLVNEIYCKGNIDPEVLMSNDDNVMDEKIAQVKEELLKAIDQPDVARVRVQRWYPGVVEELVEEVEVKKGTKKISVTERLLSEATANLEKKRQMQMNVTKEKTVEELLADQADVHHSAEPLPEVTETVVAVEGLPVEDKPKPRTRRLRQRMRSSPVVGGGLFEDSTYGTQRTGADITKSVMKRQESLDAKEGAAKKEKPLGGDVESQVPGATAADTTVADASSSPAEAPAASAPVKKPRMRRKMLSVPVRGAGGLFGAQEPDEEEQRATFESFRKEHEKKRDQFFAKRGPSGISAEIHVEGEVIKVRISQETLDNLRKGASGQMVNGNVFGVTMASEDAPVVNMLHGYVRAPPTLGKITEEAASEAPSEISEDDIADVNNGEL